MPPCEAWRQPPQEFCLTFRVPGYGKHELSCTKQRKASEMDGGKGDYCQDTTKSVTSMTKRAREKIYCGERFSREGEQCVNLKNRAGTEITGRKSD